MSHFLVIYDRKRRHPPKVERIDDARAAQLRLFELEDELRGDPDQAVVMLMAAREEDLHRTHAHYFKSRDELIELVG